MPASVSPMAAASQVGLQSDANGNGSKRKRVTRACDQCHRGGTKCAPGWNDPTICGQCQLAGTRCTYTRPVKRRGPPQRRKDPAEPSRPHPPPQRQASPHNVLDNLILASHVPPSTVPAETDQDPRPIVDASVSPLSAVPSSLTFAGPIGTIPVAPLIVPSSQHDESPSFSGGLPGGSSTQANMQNFADDLVTGDGDWVYEEVLGHETISYLMEEYYRSAYALRPYFHWPTFIAKISWRQYRIDRPFYAVVMAACSIAAARLPDGTQISTPSRVQTHVDAQALSRACYDACLRAIPIDFTQRADFQYLRCKAILSPLCVQTGDLRAACLHMNDYCAISADMGFHLESNWPSDLKEYERQERRRCFWYMYMHDTYMATTFGHTIRHREAQSTVLFPAEAWDDEDISDTQYHIRSDRVSFLRGWNYVVDLYRILEHVVSDIRARSPPTLPDEPGAAVTGLLSRPAFSTKEYMSAVQTMFDRLPNEFKNAKPITGSPREDRYGYIASNCLITTHTVRIFLAGNLDRSVHQRCAIASELFDDLSNIPTSYINSSGIFTLHHLANIGHLLCNAIRPPLTAWTYFQVRNILLALADYLGNLEATRAAAKGVSMKLRNHLQEIESFINQMALERARVDPFNLTPALGQGLLNRWSVDGSAAPRGAHGLVNMSSSESAPADPTSALGARVAKNVTPIGPSAIGLLPEVSTSNAPIAEDPVISDAPETSLVHVTTTHGPSQPSQLPTMDQFTAAEIVFNDKSIANQDSFLSTSNPFTGITGGAGLANGVAARSATATPSGGGMGADFWDNFPHLDFQDLLMSGFPKTPDHGQPRHV